MHEEEETEEDTKQRKQIGLRDSVDCLSGFPLTIGHLSPVGEYSALQVGCVKLVVLIQCTVWHYLFVVDCVNCFLMYDDQVY